MPSGSNQWLENPSPPGFFSRDWSFATATAFSSSTKPSTASSGICRPAGPRPANRSRTPPGEKLWRKPELPSSWRGCSRCSTHPPSAAARVRGIFLARPAGDPTPRTTPNEHSLEARWVTRQEVDRLATYARDRGAGAFRLGRQRCAGLSARPHRSGGLKRMRLADLSWIRSMR